MTASDVPYASANGSATAPTLETFHVRKHPTSPAATALGWRARDGLPSTGRTTRRARPRLRVAEAAWSASLPAALELGPPSPHAVGVAHHPPAAVPASPHRRRVGAISAQTRQQVLRYVALVATVATPWGKATHRGGVRSSARRGQAVHDEAQLLETSAGERLVRFSYATDGASRRGPVTLRERDLAKLRCGSSTARRAARALEASRVA
jgi:hypothetical protein